jgi:hypothetical protein
MVFKAHRKASRDQGLTSRLRYVGIGMSVYTLAYTLLSVSGNERTLQSIDQVTSSHPLDEHNDDFELLELEFEEASSFDFIKSLQKITYR